MEDDETTAEIIDAALAIHRRVGPGLLESVYEALLAAALSSRGIKVERQRILPFTFDGIHFREGLRVDLLVEGRIVVELKSVEQILPVHTKQVLTYLRLLQLPVGLLINFGGATLKEGVRRVVNNYIPPEPEESQPPRLAVRLRGSA
ncbi:MAG: GxxExxY protein [Gemmatimonadota bacterium]|nr:GxxExxY protein [Gemmatimonadota bacterium]